jgi:hypothetical protein
MTSATSISPANTAAGPAWRRATRRPAEAFSMATRPIPARAGSYQLGFLDGMSVDDAKAASSSPRRRHGLGQGTTVWRLRDWGVSRQRYWGTPIPFIHCDACGVVPVPKAQLPVVLPEDVSFRHARQSARPPPDLEARRPARNAARPARRETDTLDTFRRFSSWYFLRFASQPGDKPFEGGRPLLAAGRAVYRRHRARDPAPALRALLDPRAAPIGLIDVPSRSPACSRRAW